MASARQARQEHNRLRKVENAVENMKHKLNNDVVGFDAMRRMEYEQSKPMFYGIPLSEKVVEVVRPSPVVVQPDVLPQRLDQVIRELDSRPFYSRYYDRVKSKFEPIESKSERHLFNTRLQGYGKTAVKFGDWIARRAEDKKHRHELALHKYEIEKAIWDAKYGGEGCYRCGLPKRDGRKGSSRPRKLCKCHLVQRRKKNRRNF